MCINWVCLRSGAYSLKSLPAFEQINSQAMNILWVLQKYWRSSRYIIMIVEQLTRLVQMTPLMRTSSVDAAQTFLKLCVFEYGPSKKLLSNNG